MQKIFSHNIEIQTQNWDADVETSEKVAKNSCIKIISEKVNEFGRFTFSVLRNFCNGFHKRIKLAFFVTHLELL
jgi:hypothetical protein